MTTHGLELWLDVPFAFAPRSAVVEEALDQLFSIEVMATSKEDDLDLGPIVGQPARLSVTEPRGVRTWTGIVAEAEVLHATRRDLASYRFRIVPPLWLLTQRVAYRVYQYQSEVDIALALLAEWDIHPILELDPASYRRRKYRIQYGETDHAFFSRMLEDAGVAFWFIARENHTYLVLGDRPGAHPPKPALLVRDDLGMHATGDWARSVTRELEVRPGTYAVRDVDPRIPPETDLVASARIPDEAALESPLEVFEYEPGFMQFVVETADTPAADDRGAARTDERAGAALAQRRLEALRATRDTVRFETNVHDLVPGDVVPLRGDGPAVVDGEPLLVIGTQLFASSVEPSRVTCLAVPAVVPWRPARLTPKPLVDGVESATVVGPPGEEIYTDEFGRVRVSFHWDRESKYDSSSSCWIPVAQPWAGRGYGGVNLPRIGQEVLVDFIGGDPDRPVITGRVYTGVAKVPYALPAAASESGWRSNSTGGKSGFNEIRWQDRAGQELFSMQAEQDLSEDVVHDDTRGITGSRGVTVHGGEVHDVVAGRTVSVTGRIDEDNWKTDTLLSQANIDVTATTSIFAHAQMGMVSLARETIAFDGDEIAFDCGTGIEAVSSEKCLMRISGPGNAAGLPPGGGAGLVAFLATMLDINLGAPVPGERPITEAEAENDRLWEQEERARYDAMSDGELRSILEGRRRAGVFAIDIERPVFSNLGDRAATVDYLVGISARERSLGLDRPIAADVSNRLPRPRQLRPTRDLRRGRRANGT